jgi:hypothetical protein
MSDNHTPCSNLSRSPYRSNRNASKLQSRRCGCTRLLKQMSLPQIGRNSLIRLALVLLLPLLILGIDFYFFPVLLSKNVINHQVSLGDVLEKQNGILGTFRTHRIRVSIDDIQERQYLPFVRGRPNALLVSIFAEEGGATASGALERAILARTKDLSPNDFITIRSKLAAIGKLSEGQVVDAALNIPAEGYRSFPIDHFFFIVLPTGHPDPERLKKAFGRALDLGQGLGIENFIIPCLATRWDDNGKNALALDQYFKTFFDGLPTATHPDTIYLSLYKQWPSFELEAAVEALNATWQASTEDKDGDYVVYRRDLRLVLIALIICLLVCDFLVKYTLKNFLIVALGFAGLGLGANKWIDILVPGQSANVQLAIEVVILIIFAMAFPIIVTWNPKEIFNTKD